jgi:hypothetical protein
MSTKQAFTKRVKVNKHLYAEITAMPPNSISCEWDPAPPPKLSRQELERYFHGRDELVAELAKALGIGVLMADTNGRIRMIGPDGSISIPAD